MRALYKPQFFYHFIRNRTPNPSDNITLYELPQFEDRNTFDRVMASEFTSNIYKQLTPILFANRLRTKVVRNFVTKLEFNPPTLSLQAQVLRLQGQTKVDMDIDNVVPLLYGDLVAAQKLPFARQPFFIDTEMIYFNTILKQIFLFHKEGVWHEQNLNHRQLSLNSRYDQKKWFDYYTHI